MKRFVLLLASVYLWLMFMAVSLLCTPIALLLKICTMPFDKRLAVLQQFSCFWGSLYSWLCPVSLLRIEGLRQVDRRKAYVMVANHQSFFDIIVIDRTFLHYKWVAKAMLFKVPFVGWRMRMNRNVRIDRDNVSSQKKMLNDCLAHLAEGSSVMIFPEGTRSDTDTMGRFRNGAFYIARQAGADILPMVITGTRQLLPKGSFVFRDFGRLRLRILPPVSYAEFKDLSDLQTADLVKQRMQQVLDTPC